MLNNYFQTLNSSTNSIQSLLMAGTTAVFAAVLATQDACCNIANSTGSLADRTTSVVQDITTHTKNLLAQTSGCVGCIANNIVGATEQYIDRACYKANGTTAHHIVAACVTAAIAAVTACVFAHVVATCVTTGITACHVVFYLHRRFLLPTAGCIILQIHKRESGFGCKSWKASWRLRNQRS